LNVRDYGALGNGSADDQTAIQNTINAAKSAGVGVYVPAGTYNHSGLITVNGVTINGDGATSILRSTDVNNCAVHLQGTGSIVANMKLMTTYTGDRLSAPENGAAYVDAATNFHIDHLTIDGTFGSTGIFSSGASHGLITNNTVKNTLADSIHNTGKSSYITIDSNYIENSGDDGIAVVSYVGDGGLVHDIIATNNVIRNNPWGRNMSVVGGNNVTYDNNYLDGNSAGLACIYLATEVETNYTTYGAANVHFSNNTIENCGSTGTGQGAICIFGPSNSPYYNNGLTITNTLINVPTGQPAITVQDSHNQNISFNNYRVQSGTVNFDACIMRALQAFVCFRHADQVIQNVPWTSGAVGYTPKPCGANGAIYTPP
jgi:polygalacturonase